MNDNYINPEALSNYIWHRGGFKPCREGWNFNDKSFGCYYISDNALTWSAANEVCRNMSSCLTDIITIEDLNWIGNYGNVSFLGAWVGGRQHGHVYQWECQQYNYQKQINPYSALWANGEPKPDKTTQCVQIWKISTGFWLDDHGCYLSKRFVCKSLPLIR